MQHKGSTVFTDIVPFEGPACSPPTEKARLSASRVGDKGARKVDGTVFRVRERIGSPSSSSLSIMDATFCPLLSMLHAEGSAPEQVNPTEISANTMRAPVFTSLFVQRRERPLLGLSRHRPMATFGYKQSLQFGPWMVG